MSETYTPKRGHQVSVHGTAGLVLELGEGAKAGQAWVRLAHGETVWLPFVALTPDPEWALRREEAA